MKNLKIVLEQVQALSKLNKNDAQPAIYQLMIGINEYVNNEKQTIDNPIALLILDALKPKLSTKPKAKTRKRVVPTYEEFEEYALLKSKTVDLEKLKWKYESWKVNNWGTGKNRPISNWKTTLLNTLQYLQSDGKADKKAYNRAEAIRESETLFSNS